MPVVSKEQPVGVEEGETQSIVTQNDTHVRVQQDKRPLIGSIGGFLQKHTWGSLTIDVKRSHILDDAFDDASEESLYASSNPFVDIPSTNDRAVAVRRARFSDNGSRVKSLRHVSFGPQVRHGNMCHADSRAFDVAVGLVFELDSARFRPKARLRICNTASVGLFPCPHIKVQRRIPLRSTGFSLRVSYFCPMRDVLAGRAYKPPARLIMTLDDDQNYGMRLSHAGLELSGNTWVTVPYLGEGRIQASGLIHIPNTVSLGLDESHRRGSPKKDSPRFPYIEPMRCGFKTRW